MKSIYSMRLRELVEEQGLNVAYRSTDYDKITTSNINVARPSLQLVGFFDYFEQDRIRLWGNTETAFIRTLPPERRREVLDGLLSRKIPALILCNYDKVLQPDNPLYQACERNDVTLLTTAVDTSEMISRLSDSLRYALSPRTTVHGVLVQVHGEGMLITGESGIGKTEVALELVKRGHRLVADDAVELRRTSTHVLEGCSPPMIRYLMELRGVGLIDVRRIFGVGAVLPKERLDLVVDFIRWKENMEYDRLGLEEETCTFLDVEVPKITIPVAPARNLAIILEVAAINHRQRKLGYNTAEEFLRRHDAGIDSGSDAAFRN